MSGLGLHVLRGVKVSKDIGRGLAMAEGGNNRFENAQRRCGMTLDKFGPGPDFPEDRFGRKMFGGNGGNGRKSFPLFGLKVGAAEQSEMIDIIQVKIDARDDFERFLPVILVQGGPCRIG